MELIIKKRRTQINAKEAVARKERLPQLKEKIRPEIEAFLVNYEKLFCKNQKVNRLLHGFSKTAAKMHKLGIHAPLCKRSVFRCGPTF